MSDLQKNKKSKYSTLMMYTTWCKVSKCGKQNRQKQRTYLGYRISHKLPHPSFEQTSLGTINATLIEPMEVFRLDILKHTINIIIVHYVKRIFR